MTKNRQEAFGEVDKQEGAADEATQAQAQDTEAPQPEEDEEKDEAQMIPYAKYKVETDRLKERNAALEEQVKTLQDSPEVPAEIKEQLETMKRELDEKDAAMARLELSGRIERELVAAGCQDAPLMLKAIDLDAVKVSDDGKLEGLDVDSLKADKPYLFVQPQPISNAAPQRGSAPEAPVKSARDGLDSRYNS